MRLWLACAVVGIAALLVLLLVLWPSGRFGARAGRLTRLGRLAARLATSRSGAWLRRLFADAEGRARIDEARRRADAERVAAEMGQMKGALMKLGQMLSFVSDDVPAEYRLALSSLQASAPPMDFPLIRDVIERELGRPLERAFLHFEREPLAAASIGQVHRAVLSSGEDAVVKVQYPGVAEAIRADLDNADMLYRMMGMMYSALDPKPVVDELRARIGEELDYELEARSQSAFADLFEGHPYIGVPRVYAEYSTGHVLTSELVEAKRYAEVLDLPKAQRDRYGEILYRFIVGCVFEFGVFNGDPHPGNYLFDGDRVVFLDFGCVKYFPPTMLARWKRLMAAHLSGRPGDFRELLVEFGFIGPDSDLATDDLYEYFGYFYEPFREDRMFRFSHEYTRRSFRMVFAPEGRFAGFQKKLNMPRDFVFVNRIQWGAYSVLAELGAEANWHRIHREFVFGDAPATALGEQEIAFREAWRRERGLAPGDLMLTPDGVKTRPARAP